MIIRKKTEAAFNVIIIGAGPAGISAAYELCKKGTKKKILMVEAGKQYIQRFCLNDLQKSCHGCGGICNTISGFGGCVVYGDGLKISNLPSGQRLRDLYGARKLKRLSKKALQLFNDVVRIPTTFSGSNLPQKVEQVFKLQNIRIKKYPVSVVKESHLKRFIKYMYQYLGERIEILFETEMISLRREHRKGLFIVTTRSKSGTSKYFAQKVILAMGRKGTTCLNKMIKSLNIHTEHNDPSIGVRFEMSSKWLKKIGNLHPDFKASYTNKEGLKAKSFCFCGGNNGGRLRMARYYDSFSTPIVLLDGHITSERKDKERLLAGNFAVLTKLENTKRKKNLAKMIDKYMHLFSGHPIIQPLTSFHNKTQVNEDDDAWIKQLPFKPTLNALKTGSLHLLFEKEQHAIIIELFKRIMKSILILEKAKMEYNNFEKEVLVAGPEIEFIWSKVSLNSYGESSCPGLYIIGDAAGYAQGMIQSMIMGIGAAEHANK